MAPSVGGVDDQSVATAKDDWVATRLMGVAMDNTVQSIAGAVLMTPVVVFVMYGLISPFALGLWVLTATCVLVLRYALLRTFRLGFVRNSADSAKFVQRHLWTWPLVSFSWAIPAILCSAYPQSEAYFVSMVIVVGVAMAGTSAFAAVPKACSYYLMGIVVPSFLALVWRIWQALPGPVPIVYTAAALMLLVMWWLMSMAGKRYYRVQYNNFALQFDNEELIASLTAQTRTALRAVAAKNRFLASAAHDLRQPVHALGLYASWLQDDPDMSAELAPKMLSATRAVNELFDSLFDLTRIDAGHYRVQVQAVSVNDLFGELVDQYAPFATDRGVVLRVRGRDSVIQSDPVVLRRILGNYLSNAIKHTRHGGVLLGSRQRNDGLVFEVWDTGLGIAPEHQEAVFQEFYRVAQHAGSEDSLGLGLTIVARLSALLGYTPSLSSVRERGTVFRLHVGAQPVLSAEAVVKQPPIS